MAIKAVPASKLKEVKSNLKKRILRSLKSKIEKDI